MSVKFFGQFLIERGQLDAGQLRDALDLMESENRSLGELAVEAGFASAEEIRRVNGAQRRKDLRFGELAMQMGVLNSVELDELLHRQKQERVNLEDALVRLGFMSAERAAHLIDEFKLDQAAYLEGDGALSEELAGNRLATGFVDLFTRYCLRVGHIEVKLGPGSPLEEPPDLQLVASLEITGNHGIHVALASDLEFGEQLAIGVSGLELSELAKELAADAIGEFLNVLAGNLVSILEQEGFEHRVSAPCFGVLPSEGHQFSVVSNTGSALLVISRH